MLIAAAVTLCLTNATPAAVSGLVRDERGTEHPFGGWLGLLTLLDTAHQNHSQGA